MLKFDTVIIPLLCLFSSFYFLVFTGLSSRIKFPILIKNCSSVRSLFQVPLCIWVIYIDCFEFNKLVPIIKVDLPHQILVFTDFEKSVTYEYHTKGDFDEEFTIIIRVNKNIRSIYNSTFTYVLPRKIFNKNSETRKYV